MTSNEDTWTNRDLPVLQTVVKMHEEPSGHPGTHGYFDALIPEEKILTMTFRARLGLAQLGHHDAPRGPDGNVDARSRRADSKSARVMAFDETWRVMFGFEICGVPPTGCQG